MGAYVDFYGRVSLQKKKYNFPGCQHTFDSLNKKTAASIAADKTINTVQISGPIPKNKVNLVNSIFEKRPDITFRVFGFYSERCDLAFLRELDKVRKLSVDCINDADNVDILRELHLKELRLEIFDLQDYSVIEEIDGNLEKLSLSKVRDKKDNFDCRWLLRFHNLRELYLGRLKKNIEELEKAKSLKTFTMRGIKVCSLDFLKKSKVENLSIHWCGMNDLTSLEGNDNIKSLELWRINKLSDISFIDKMPKLRTLRLIDLTNIKNFPKATGSSLETIYAENLKNLEDISEMEKLEKLKSLELLGAPKIEISQLKPLFEKPGIETINCRGMGKREKQEEIDKMKAEYKSQTGE